MVHPPRLRLRGRCFKAVTWSVVMVDVARLGPSRGAARMCTILDVDQARGKVQTQTLPHGRCVALLYCPHTPGGYSPWQSQTVFQKEDKRRPFQPSTLHRVLWGPFFQKKDKKRSYTTDHVVVPVPLRKCHTVSICFNEQAPAAMPLHGAATRPKSLKVSFCFLFGDRLENQT